MHLCGSSVCLHILLPHITLTLHIVYTHMYISYYVAYGEWPIDNKTQRMMMIIMSKGERTGNTNVRFCDF